MHIHAIGMHRVSIIGASGYSGMELVRILLAHPSIQIVAAGSDKFAGRAFDATAATRALTFVPQADAIAADCDVAFLATPAEVSLDLAPQLLAKGRRVVD